MRSRPNEGNGYNEDAILFMSVISSNPKKPTVVSVMGVNASYIGGMQIWSRELSRVLEGLGWNSVLCFATPPSEDVKAFFNLPNISFEVLDNSWELAAKPVTEELQQYKASSAGNRSSPFHGICRILSLAGAHERSSKSILYRSSLQA